MSISFDSYPSAVSIDELDRNIIGMFTDTINKRGRIHLDGDMMTNLVKLKLIRDDKATIAANLLFGDPDCCIHIGRFKSPATIIDDNVVRGPLLSVVDEAMIFIKKHINLEYHFDGSIQRIERWQYPLEALRELLLNCIVHRDYKNLSDIVIKIFDDHILFTNPGRLYGDLSLEDLQRDDYTSSLRNKLLAEAFYLTGDIEKFGTGFVRIRQYLQEYPEISISIEERGDFFRVALQQAGTVTPHVIPHVTPHVEKLLPLCQVPAGREKLQVALGVKDRKYFYEAYLKPALQGGLVEFTIPDKPKSKLQQYKLTDLGHQVLDRQEGS